MKNKLTHIEQIISNSLSKHIDKTINDTTLSRVAETIKDTFPVPHTKVGDCRLLWNTMSLKDKFMWWVGNSVFPKFGETIRKYHTLLLYYGHPDVADIPSWANSNPRQVVVADVYFTPDKPVEYINLTMTV